MLRIYACLTEQHDLRLVALAGLICLFACYTGLDLLARARDLARGRGVAWSWAAAIVFGSGIWATHFVAELAYSPGLPVGYDVGLTTFSLAVAVVLSWFGMMTVLRRGAPLLGGGIVGAAAGAMHYVGMAALRAPATMLWKPAYVVASIVVAMGLAALAMRVLSRGSTVRWRVGAAALLVLAIVGMHFTGMAAIVLEPNPLITVPDAVAAPGVVAVAVAAVTVVIILLGMSGLVLDNKLAWQAAREAVRLRDSEARLRQSERHLARAQVLAEIGSFEWNQATGRVVWSDNLYEIYGVEKESFVITRENVQALVHPDDRTRLAEADRLWLAGREANTFEYRILLPSGECRHLITEREAIHDEKGGLVALFGAVRDVTVAKAAELRQSELESRLQHAQRLEALGTLAGGIAHDLNNTMVPVVVLAKLLTKHFMPGSREHANLQTIQAAGAHARELMQQVMSFSRIHAPSKLAIDLVELLREMRPMLGMLVPSTICIDEAIAAVPPVSVDPTQLRQVVVNLVVNAVQAIGTETGTITIALAAEANAPAREYENAPAAPRIHLSVRDTGCGMDEATMLRVFEPFFTTKKVGEGTGLGLSIAHGVVTEHGGHLAVESRIGVGTCFSVYLPARSAHDAARESGAADAAA